MLKYLILVVQNLLTTSILLALLFALAHLGGSQKQKNWLLRGCVVGIVSAFVLAVFKHTTVLINREYFNIGILSVAVVSGILFYLLIWDAFKKGSPELQEKLASAIYAALAASLLLYALPDIFLYPTEFVLPGESALSTDFLLKLIGYVGGLLVVGVSGLALYKAGASLSFRLVRILATAGLALNMLNQIAAIVQPLLARRIIPMQKWLFDIIKPVINHNEYFLYALMALTLLLPVALWIKTRRHEETYPNPALRRKARAATFAERRWFLTVFSGYIVSGLILTAVRAYDEQEIVLSPAEPITLVGDEIVISLDNVKDGHLHRFVYTASDNTDVRFIVIKKNSNAYGVGLDACEICGPTGYYERGDGKIVCKLCDVVMNVATIGFRGGCNPVPLAYTIREGSMVVGTQQLENEKGRFA